MLNYNRMKAPGDKRPTWRGGVLQVHVTRACDLACTNCTQGSNLAGKPTIISLEHFEEAIWSLQDYYGVIGIFGGNPCIHPQFPELCRILAKYIPMEQRGLWSNNLNGHGKLCRETFNPEYSNLNVHCSQSAFMEMIHDWPECHPKGLDDSRHSPPWVALNDVQDLTHEQRCELIENCDINQYWSAMICVVRNRLRGFFCELAGAQAMLHEREESYPDTGIPITRDWWKHPIGYFHHQIDKHCFECGIPLRGKGSLSLGKDEFVSKTHLSIYKLKKPQDKSVHLVEKLEQLNGNLTRATDYIENGVA
jgi:hypothetical protein